MRNGMAAWLAGRQSWLAPSRRRWCGCWLAMHYAGARYAQNLGKFTMAQGDYHQRTVERAQRRYLAAIKALARVRRLLTPAVQVSIADQQINIAT